ncbi:CWC16 protein [Lasiosphaeria miniovina]|uniref:Splicing factor YJU2 n=1 Tax=Lasiosphaeria miniovina TaxID=1954250 RepID=A0AA40E8R1_9PEZI|nr:CWC16 protein [Lasiosphaeria miniovina]KAK0728166.1 CWC16 protein [Lasiosphaeria miniovina]
MSERKVLSKYYPPDFDPTRVGRTRGLKQVGPKVQTVRLMAPFSMQCTSCGEYRGRKFNARKETPPDERYLNIQLYRFYIRCTRCSAEVVFRTDPRRQDYVVEKGAKRNTEPWRRGLEEEIEESDEARLDRIEREMAEAEGQEERNAMAELESKTADAKREMAVADALDEIRSRNARLERASRDGVEVEVVVPEDEERRRQDEEDAAAARRAFAFARTQEKLEELILDDVEEEDDGGPFAGGPSSLVSPGANSSTNGASGSTPVTSTKPAASTVSTDMPPPSFKRQIKKKKDHSALLGIKKKGG